MRGGKRESGRKSSTGPGRAFLELRAKSRAYDINPRPMGGTMLPLFGFDRSYISERLEVPEKPEPEDSDE